MPKCRIKRIQEAYWLSETRPAFVPLHSFSTPQFINLPWLAELLDKIPCPINKFSLFKSTKFEPVTNYVQPKMESRMEIEQAVEPDLGHEWSVVHPCPIRSENTWPFTKWSTESTLHTICRHRISPTILIVQSSWSWKSNMHGVLINNKSSGFHWKSYLISRRSPNVWRIPLSNTQGSILFLESYQVRWPWKAT